MSPYLADLLWLMEGHFIESDLDIAVYWRADWRDDFERLCHCPEELDRAIAECKSHFLGSYFEVLFSFAIRHFSTLTILLEHQQIIDQGKTLGEVDMLVETPSGELLQFEIAIKFYLQRFDLYPDHWIGPNKNDSLNKKTTRARQHQLRILETKSAQSQYSALIQGRAIKSCLLVYGRLFLPLKPDVSAVEQLNDSVFGGWIHASKAYSLVADFTCVITLEKPHWLSLQNFTRPYKSFTTEYVDAWIEDFEHDARPKLLSFWCESRNVTSPGYCVFVVPDTW